MILKEITDTSLVIVHWIVFGFDTSRLAARFFISLVMRDLRPLQARRSFED
jgi:hypothetical protein